MNEGRIYAFMLTTNRFGSHVVVEMTEPPTDWRCPAYIHLRCFSLYSGETLFSELVHAEEEAAKAWWELTGVSLESCLAKGKGWY